MKTVFYRLKDRPAVGAFTIEFWTKEDRTNVLEFKSVTMDETKLWTRISFITGDKKFVLHQVKAKR